MGLSALLVSTNRAMRRPIERGTSDRTGSTFSFICKAIKNKISLRSQENVYFTMNNEAEFFRGNKWLYHFTKFDTALKIIRSMRLKYSILSQTNDICENAKIIYNESFGDCEDGIFKDIKHDIYLYRQISLSEDKNVFGRRGFDLQQMWGLYADNGYGVCLVFDKNEFIASLPSSCIHNEVVYKTDLTPDTFFKVENKSEIVSFIKKNINALFFNKRKEWEHEQEYRVLNKFESEEYDIFHDFKNSLKYVILCNSKTIDSNESILNSCEYCYLKRILPPSIKILIYSSFANNSSLTHYLKDSNSIEFWNSLEEYGRIVDIDTSYTNKN